MIKENEILILSNETPLGKYKIIELSDGDAYRLSDRDIDIEGKKGTLVGDNTFEFDEPLPHSRTKKICLLNGAKLQPIYD